MRKALIAALLAFATYMQAQTSNDSVWRTISLPEVTVKMKPVEQSGDTVKYNVSAFQDKGDRYIEDVLKKLPGIEVSGNGTISYKGKSINRFNIEGQDLLGNRYNQATRNLPVEAVAQVQVMENDQTIQALKDVLPSERTTLNIKLKQGYRAKPFGEAQGGIGVSDNTLWDNHITLIDIAQKNQFLVTAKMNNTGTNLDDNTMEHIDVTDIENNIPLPAPLLTSGGTRFLPVKENRFLKNKSFSVGLNHIQRIGTYGSLRTNITWHGTGDNHTDSTSNIFGGAHTTRLSESNHTRTHRQTFIPQWRYELNSPKIYLTDDLSASLSYTSNSNLLSSNVRALEENTAQHPFYIQNKLRMTLNTGGMVYGINSFTRYFRRSETMDVADMTDVYDTNERITFDRFLTRNGIYTSFRLLDNMLKIGYNVEFRSDRMKVDGGGYRSAHYLKNALTTEYTIHYGRGHITLGLPLNTFTYSIPWQTTDKRKSKYYISPTIRWRHEFSPFWRMNIRGGIGHDTADDVLHPETYHSNYRTIVHPAEQPMWAHNSNIMFSLNYADMINMFTWNITASASWRKSDLHTTYDYEDVYTLVAKVAEKKSSRIIYAKTSAEKTFTNAGTSLKGTLNYTRRSMPIEQNGLAHTVGSNVLSTMLTLRWNKLKWLQCHNETTANLSWQDDYNNSNSHSLKSLFNELAVSLYPLKAVGMEISWEQSAIETSRNKYNSNAFIDTKLFYTPTKRIELTLQLTNLLNRQRYIDASYNGFNYRYFSMPLRGREVLLAVKFKI